MMAKNEDLFSRTKCKNARQSCKIRCALFAHRVPSSPNDLPDSTTQVPHKPLAVVLRAPGAALHIR
jgi:hypothetical protein